MPHPLKKFPHNYGRPVYGTEVYPRPHVRPIPSVEPQTRRPKRTKRQNPFVALLRACISLSFMGLMAWYVFPVISKDYFEPMFLNRFLNRNIKPNAALYVSPTLNYISNSSLYGKNILVPQTKKGILTKISSSGIDTALTGKINTLMSKYPQLKPSIYIWDYETARSVEINADTPVPVASIIKLPVLFELFRQIDRPNEGFEKPLNAKVPFEELYRTSGSGDMQYKSANVDYTVDKLANLMITRSDNSATNILLDNIGGKAAMNRAFRSWGLGHSMMSDWLPDTDGTNKMSAKDVATLLYNLDNPAFLSAQSRVAIQEYMSQVENRTLLKAGLPEDALLLHKTGDIGKMLGDAGIVYRVDGGKYLIVTLVRRSHNDYSARDFIKEVSRVVYSAI